MLAAIFLRKHIHFLATGPLGTLQIKLMQNHAQKNIFSSPTELLQPLPNNTTTVKANEGF